jgi:hypothetical protein
LYLTTQKRYLFFWSCKLRIHIYLVYSNKHPEGSGYVTKCRI